ncbi:MAG TPA: DUF2277 family protein [Candidatus Limnocylindria bacterium]|nr:DUF2277 family protein [Candidatus Limnocylindria bacterium]
MCRSIKTLRTPTPASEEQVRAAARQFVRKVSGFREPAPRNAEAFEEAVEAVARATDRLLERLPRSRATSAGPSPSIDVRRTTTR